MTAAVRASSAAAGVVAGAALCVLAAGAFALPWWHGPTVALLVDGPSAAIDPLPLAGWAVAGWTRTAAVAVLALAALVAVSLRRRLPQILPAVAVVAAGTAAATVGVLGFADRGPASAAGAWIAVVAGIAAVLLVVVRSIRLVAVVAVAALVVVLLPGARAAHTEGPFVRIDAVPADQLGTVDGAAAALTATGVSVVDAAGRATLVAALQERGGTVLGIAGRRVARWVAADTVVIAGLDPGDPVWVTVRDVGAAGPVGADGTLWLRAVGDPAGAIRSLNLAAYDGEQALAAAYLPVVTIAVPGGVQAINAATLFPTKTGGLRFAEQEVGYRLERVEPTPDSAIVRHLAGGADPTCGASRTATDAFLARSGPVAVDADGGIWFAVDREGRDTLARLGPDGVLRAVPAPVPGRVHALVATADGAIVLIAVADAGPVLWRLPAAGAALADLPPTPEECIPAPPQVGPGVTLVPVGNSASDALGVPLGVDGRWASGRRGGLTPIEAVVPGERVPLGTRNDGELDRLQPDGVGGVWWVERVAGTTFQLVHGTPNAVEQRFPPVELPEPFRLVTDLSGQPPLAATPRGALRISEGAVSTVVPGDVRGGVVRAGGRGWLLVDGRLVATDGNRVVGPVVDAGERNGDTTPIAVQLARGVAPDRLALPRATVGLDGNGRAVVVADGVVLAVDDAGGVRVVAQDQRLGPTYAVEGGLVVHKDGTLLRVDLPG
ncbi:hypothetical protein [Pseudonocardia sp. TRM90224]|uniref:hypothetical protein n=1 Tax=Pseudonocardia sp. TRM90224 TaxID=2812678 RepID=UPI001E4AD8AD|nr:hypothetical protein [Pseudonocardia sp. TRM90224]